MAREQFTKPIPANQQSNIVSDARLNNELTTTQRDDIVNNAKMTDAEKDNMIRQTSIETKVNPIIDLDFINKTPVEIDINISGGGSATETQKGLELTAGSSSGDTLEVKLNDLINPLLETNNLTTLQRFFLILKSNYTNNWGDDLKIGNSDNYIDIPFGHEDWDVGGVAVDDLTNGDFAGIGSNQLFVVDVLTNQFSDNGHKLWIHSLYGGQTFSWTTTNTLGITNHQWDMYLESFGTGETVILTRYQMYEFTLAGWLRNIQLP